MGSEVMVEAPAPSSQRGPQPLVETHRQTPGGSKTVSRFQLLPEVIRSVKMMYMRSPLSLPNV